MSVTKVIRTVIIIMSMVQVSRCVFCNYSQSLSNNIAKLEQKIKWQYNYTFVVVYDHFFITRSHRKVTEICCTQL